MEQQFSALAALIAEPVRAKVLWTLLDGRAYTATELAVAAETSSSNISMHLSKLLKADLLRVEVQGRHRYYTLSRSEVAYAVEAMAGLLSSGTAEAPRDVKRVMPSEGITYCRSCYDHMAGRMGVAITQALIRQHIIEYKGREFEVSPAGERWLAGWGIDCALLRLQRRSFAKPCLDWTERMHHLSGSLGAALLTHMIKEDWVRCKKHTRELVVTAKGEQQLAHSLHI